MRSPANHTPEEQQLLNLVAKLARTQLSSIEPIDRARALEGMALILPTQEAEQCRVVAQAIRDAEQAQLILSDLLTAL